MIKKIVKKIDERIKRYNYYDAYLLSCSLEQCISDYAISNNRYSKYINVIRKLCLNLLKILFNKDKKINLKTILDKIKKIPELKKFDYCINSEVKIPECFKNFGFYIEDFMNTKINVKECRILGLRTAGSYLAPIITFVLNSKNYITIRPGFRIKNKRIGKGEKCPFLLSIKEKKFLNSIKTNEKIIIIDEGPGTGITMNSSITFFINKGFSNNNIFAVTTRKYFNKNIPKNNIINIQNKYFDNICKEDIHKLEEILNLRFNSLNNFYENSDIKEYDNPKKIIRFKNGRKNINLIAKFIGTGLYGLEEFQKIKLMNEFSERVICFDRGVLFYIHEAKLLNTGSNHLEKINIKYAFSRIKNLKFKREKYSSFLINFKNLLISKGIIDWELKTKYKKNMLLILNNIECELKNKKYFYGDIDWKLEKENWIKTKDKIIKRNMFNCGDFANHPKSNILVQITGFWIEFFKKEKLNNYFNTLVIDNRKVSYKEVLLSSLYYLYWKTNYYNYIIENISNYAVKIDYIKSRLQYLQSVMNYLIKKEV